MGKNWFHQIVDPWTKDAGHTLKQLLPGNPFGEDPAAPAFGYNRSPQQTADQAPPVTGNDLLSQVLANYGSSMQQYGITPGEVATELANSGLDLTKKDLKAGDIMAALTPLGLESNFKYKVSHAPPATTMSPEATAQMLNTIAGYQKPFLDNMKASANYGGALVGDLAKYLSPRSAAAYGDLTKGYVGQANMLANLIPAENASILTQLASGGGTKAASSGGGGFGSLLAAAATAGSKLPGTP